MRANAKLPTANEIAAALADAGIGDRPLKSIERDGRVAVFLPGDSRPFDIYEQAQADRSLARRIGETLGGILTDQHTSVVEDRALLARIDEALALRKRIVHETGERVLTHSDLGFQNIAFDPATLDVIGVFDYDGAAFSDRHFDFKNMSLHCADGSEPLLEAAASTYEQLTNVAIDRDCVRLLNAVEAIGFLGYRFGHAPEEEWCGRTLAQDLEWADKSLKAAGIDRSTPSR